MSCFSATDGWIFCSNIRRYRDAQKPIISGEREQERPSGEWSDDDYDVREASANGPVIGRHG
jgi:hypothetical protein